MDAGHGLVTLLSLSVSVKDRSLHKASWASHIFIIPSTYLGMGSLKTYCSLVVGMALSRPTVRVSFDGGGPCTALSLKLRGGGLESQFGRGPRTLG